MSELPPLEQPQAYVVVGPNDQRGPYTLDLLIGEVVAGRLHDATPVWWPGLAEWTTMNAHPGVAAEVARRRAPQAAPEPAPAPLEAPQATAPADPYAQAGSAQVSYAQPEQVQAAPVTFDVGQPVPGAEQWGAADAAVVDVPVIDKPVVDAAPDPAPVAPAPAETALGGSTGAQVPGGWTVTDTSRAPDPAGDIVEAEVVDAVPGDAAAPVAGSFDLPAETPGEAAPAAIPEVGSSVTDEHRNLFQRLVERSRHRTHAGDRVTSIDGALVDAVVAGAESQGFTVTDRTDGEVNHDLRFDGGPGETLSITLGRVKGDDPEKARAGHVPISVRFQSATYAGVLDTGTWDHGEVVVVSDEWSGQATSTVSLLLPLEDYVDAGFEVDAVSVLRDVGATVSVVSARMR